MRRDIIVYWAGISVVIVFFAALEYLSLIPQISQWVVALLTIAVLFIAIQTLIYVRDDINLFRKTVHGEVYDVAQIKKLGFVIPSKSQHPLDYGDQTDSERGELQEIELPNNRSVDLFIAFRLKEKQKIRMMTFGFEGDKNKPIVVKKIGGFNIKSVTSLPKEEFVDWHGHYHTEYANPRILAKDDVFISAYKVETRNVGNYQVRVEILADEAAKPFVGYLEAKIK